MPFSGTLRSLSASQHLPLDLGGSLSLELIEFIRQQYLTSRRAYSHVHVASEQKLPCVLQGLRSRGMTNIDARKLVAPADQEFQWRANHARGPPQGRRARAALALSPAVRSSRSDETGTSRAPLSSAGEFVDPQSPIEAVGKRGDGSRYAHPSPIASANATREMTISRAMASSRQIE
jgi:hypothetical protein